MRTRVLIWLCVMAICLGANAQRRQILNSNIKTLTVERNGKWNTLPYIQLNSPDKLYISFDDLTHEYHRYRYRIEPMTWDWKPNERLLTSEFLKRGIGDNPIDDYSESVNTTVLYTHYSFIFPNSDTQLAVSGNYQIVVYDDDEGEDVIKIPIYVGENNATIAATITTNTDIDFNASHQQMVMTLTPGASLSVHYPETELHTVVMQNMRQSSAVYNPKPDYVTPTGLKWEHCRELIFPAGNEYRKFEMTTLKHGGIGMDRIEWFDPYYHATLFTDKVRKNYIYDEEQDGAFYVNDIDDDDPATEGDYVFVHFSLDAEPDLKGRIYLNGEFTNDYFNDAYQMNYNAQSHCYESIQLLKLGYYNYQYLYVPNGAMNSASASSGSNSDPSNDYSGSSNGYSGSVRPSTAKIEGDFYQTENRYTVFAYYCERGSRYDRLIGVSDFQFALSR